MITLSKDAKLRVIGYIIMFLHICCIFAALAIIVFVTYIAACFIEYKSPIQANFKVSETVEQGGAVEATWFNVNRAKVCDYRKNYTVVANKHYWTSDEVAATPATTQLGSIPDFSYSVDLPDSLPPGPATFYAIIRYSCPGNIVEYFKPVRVVWSQQFTITSQKEKQK